MIRTILHAIAIHQSYLARPSMISKPSHCSSLEAFIKQPYLFENPQFCYSCSCKFACRYNNGPHSPGGLDYIPLHIRNPNPPNYADIGADIFPAELYPTNSKSSIE